MTNIYIIRYQEWENGPGSGCRTAERKVWAYTAADAITQYDTVAKQSRNCGGLVYVGPVREGCDCLNECRCGIHARG